MPTSKPLAGTSAPSSTPRPRRRWPLEQKRRIVEASFVPGTSIAAVAREYGVNANQLHSWRRLYQRGQLTSQAATSSDHQTLAEIRMQAVERVQAGESPEDVIQTLGFNRSCIYEWMARYRAGVRIPAKANTDSEGNANGIPGRRRTVFGA